MYDMMASFSSRHSLHFLDILLYGAACLIIFHVMVGVFAFCFSLHIKVDSEVLCLYSGLLNAFL